MAGFKTLDDVDMAGKRVMVRVDLNVPMKSGRITDATRIERVAPTIGEIADKGGRVVLLAHFGRPKGKVVPDMSLAPVAPVVAAVISRPVAFGTDCVGPMAEAAVGALGDGEVVLLENTRFHAGEEANDPQFAAELAVNGDLFVADAFSAAHRAHASTVGLADHLPAVAGRAMQAELEALEAGLGEPQRPVLAIVGGAKVSTKLKVLAHLIDKVDALVIGGGMANTFLAAQGHKVGRSLCEHEMADTAREILAKAEAAGCEIVLPGDVVVADEFAANSPNAVVGVGEVPDDKMILDAGPEAVEAVGAWIDKARTLVWNGPLGAFELQPFDRATMAVAGRAAARTKSGELVSVAGGGDTVAALNQAGVGADFTYVSTAGGAFLEWMEGADLPGVAILRG